MKKLTGLVLILILLCASLAAVSAEEELTDVRCDEWKFSLRIPAGITVHPRTYEDGDTDSVTGGGLILFGRGYGVQVMRRGRFYNAGDYLGGSFCDYLEQYGAYSTEDSRVTYRIGGRILYGNTGIVYGEQGEELFRELRVIPAGNNHGTEFIARYDTETEADALALLDTVIRYYQPDEETDPAEAKFRPQGHEDGPDLQNGRYLLRVEDADRIETDGYFTAILYMPDYYSSEDVRDMQPGDTILIMDRTLTITGIDPKEEDDGSWYEVDLFAADDFLGGMKYSFTLMPTGDGTSYWPYFGDDNHAASRVGEARIRVPQEEPVEYCEDEGDDIPVMLSDDLLADLGDDPAAFGIGWNEYTHRCTFADGSLIWIGTWPYPANPEDLLIPW